jgi:hypothetical protein
MTPRSTCSIAAEHVVEPRWHTRSGSADGTCRSGSFVPEPSRSITQLRRGPLVAHRRGMIKTLLSASAIVFTLCGPALAQPVMVKPVPAPIVTAVPVKLELTVKAGNDTRTHQLVIPEDSCGTVQEKAVDHEDTIRVCSIIRPTGMKLEVDWAVRTGPNEYRSSWGAFVTRGTTLDVGRSGGVRFTLAIK